MLAIYVRPAVELQDNEDKSDSKKLPNSDELGSFLLEIVIASDGTNVALLGDAVQLHPKQG